MKHSIISGLAVSSLLIAAPWSVASAADMPLKAPPLPAAYDWTGCYVGGNAGVIASSDKYTLSPSGNYLTAPGAAAPPNAAGTGDIASDIAALTNSYSPDGAGMLVGAQVGCNKQVGGFVFGGEADWQWTGLTSSALGNNYAAFANIGNPAFTDAAHTESVSSRLES